MTTAIETLIQAIEVQANSSKSVYKTMQKLLKELRDKHNVELGCALNKSSDVLKKECKRIVEAFKSGTVKEQPPAEEKKAKAKAAKPQTHTSEKQEKTQAPSQPKEVATDLQLAEAQAEIERLRRELADKTNEVAEYAEALAHAQQTIAQQTSVIKQQQEVIEEFKDVIANFTSLSQNIEQELTKDNAAADNKEETQAPVEEIQPEPAEPAVAEDDDDDYEPVEMCDAVDDLVLLMIHGEQQVVNVILSKTLSKLSKQRAEEFLDAMTSINFVNPSDLTVGIRNLMTTYSVKMDWLENAIMIAQAARI